MEKGFRGRSCPRLNCWSSPLLKGSLKRGDGTPVWKQWGRKRSVQGNLKVSSPDEERYPHPERGGRKGWWPSLKNRWGKKGSDAPPPTLLPIGRAGRGIKGFGKRRARGGTILVRSTLERVSEIKQLLDIYREVSFRGGIEPGWCLGTCEKECQGLTILVCACEKGRVLLHKSAWCRRNRNRGGTKVKNLEGAENSAHALHEWNESLKGRVRERAT